MAMGVRKRQLTVLSFFAVGTAFIPQRPPEYCARDIISQRRVPSLTAEQLARVSTLVQVQVVNRHGSRTPYDEFTCWKDYSIRWVNCNVTELMTASPNNKLKKESSLWLFRKLYDAGDNLLGGNCLTGQLLYEGYRQMEGVGAVLRSAYLDGTDVLRLFPSTIWEEIDHENLVYLRSDDETRTLMSGQIMIHSMFNISTQEIIDWHTEDYRLDQIYPNSYACPRLQKIMGSAYGSPEFQSMNHSTEMKSLGSSLDDILGQGHWTWMNLLDCFMTAVCNGHDVPNGDPSNGGSVMSDLLFNEAVSKSALGFIFPVIYNNSEYSKLAIGNTAWHIRSRLEEAMSSHREESSTWRSHDVLVPTHTGDVPLLESVSGSATSSGPLRLAVYSGHDTTILPLLAVLLGDKWDRKWPGYASLMCIELYLKAGSADAKHHPRGRTNIRVADISEPEKYLFRIVYNGQALLLPGCTDTLCDASVLLDALAFGKEKMPCSISPESNDHGGKEGHNKHHGRGHTGDANSFLRVSDWIILCILCSMFGAATGAAVVIFNLKRTFAPDSYLRHDPNHSDDTGALSNDRAAATTATRNPLRGGGSGKGTYEFVSDVSSHPTRHTTEINPPQGPSEI